MEKQQKQKLAVANYNPDYIDSLVEVNKNAPKK